MGTDGKSGSDTPFNFAMLYYIGLNELIAKKDAVAIDGNLWGWYRGLKAVKRRISFKAKLSGTDTEELNKKFKNAKNLLSSNIPRQIEVQMSEMIYDDVTEILEEIDEKLWVVMDKYKMIFPDIKLTGGFEEIRKRLKLELEEEKKS